jgi:hypothetical protein
MPHHPAARQEAIVVLSDYRIRKLNFLQNTISGYEN